MRNKDLEAFGELLIKRVRDETIEEWDGVVDGTMKDVVTKEIQKMLASMHPDARKILHTLIPAIVDTTMHHLLWTIEQEPRVGLTMDDSAQLRDLSDGLPGDYVGWKDRLSKQRQFPPPKPKKK